MVQFASAQVPDCKCCHTWHNITAVRVESLYIFCVHTVQWTIYAISHRVNGQWRCLRLTKSLISGMRLRVRSSGVMEWRMWCLIYRRKRLSLMDSHSRREEKMVHCIFLDLFQSVFRLWVTFCVCHYNCQVMISMSCILSLQSRPQGRERKLYLFRPNWTLNHPGNCWLRAPDVFMWSAPLQRLNRIFEPMCTMVHCVCGRGCQGLERISWSIMHCDEMSRQTKGVM